MFWTAWKKPDTGNRNIFLMDNLGNRYDHIMTGGCAAVKTWLDEEGSCEGWFLFPAPDEDARWFTFFNSYRGVAIEVSMITTPTPTTTATPTINPTLDTNR